VSARLIALAAALFLAGCGSDPDVEAAKSAVRAAYGEVFEFGDLWHAPELAPDAHGAPSMPRLNRGICGEFRTPADGRGEPRRFVWIPADRWLLRPDADGFMIFENDVPITDGHRGPRSHPNHRYLDWHQHCRRHHS